MPDNIDVVRDAKPMPQNREDPGVRIPDSVKRAAAAAEAYYTPQPDPAAPPTPPQPEPQPQPQPQLQAAPPPEPQPEPQPQPQPGEWQEGERPPGDPSTWTDAEKRYNSMKGRYDQSQQQLRSMQEQMSQMGDELVRTQQLMQTMVPGQQPAPQPTQYITPEDEATFGRDVIDLTKRAAQEALAPVVNKLETENQELRTRMQKAQRQTLLNNLDATFATSGVNWREINRSKPFVQWLSLPDVYSGVVRKTLMDRAVQAADAPRVAQFFNGFIQHAQTHGQTPQPTEPQPALQPAPQRQAAVAIETLAAPGRAHPATGNTAVPDAKPIFTHADIRKFYDDVRKGSYAGQEQLRAQHERAIFAAQHEGRVR